MSNISSSPLSVPYVVTNDLNIVFLNLQRQGIIPPDNNVILDASEKIRGVLEGIFSSVDVIEASRISGYLNSQVLQSSLPSVSLTGLVDDKLVAATLHLSRSVKRVSDVLGNSTYESIGFWQRNKKDAPYMEQFNMAADKIARTAKNAILIDDVVFSGGTTLKIAEEFAARNIIINKVIASVAIQGAQSKLAAAGIEVVADIIYSNVHDEVCMRDFIVGAPDGGRNVVSAEGNYEAAPYVLPFGDAQSWATMPEDCSKEFSRAAIEASLQIWRDVERANQRTILVGELAKPIVGMAVDQPIVKQLEYKLAMLG